jgi:hypothetical protein
MRTEPWHSHAGGVFRKKSSFLKHRMGSRVNDGRTATGRAADIVDIIEVEDDKVDIQSEQLGACALHRLQLPSQVFGDIRLALECQVQRTGHPGRLGLRLEQLVFPSVNS